MTVPSPSSTPAFTDLGFFGEFGGMYAPEPLMPALLELNQAFREIQTDSPFQQRFNTLLKDFAGRPTPLFEANRLTEAWSHGKPQGRKVLLKREDLLHGGAHKTNNAIGQALLAQHMGKTRLIAETGAGQHGVATAMAGALLGLETHVYMGELDMARQAPNVSRMKLLGAQVHPVTSGSKTLKSAVNAALRDWIANVRHTHYILGTAAGPHPFPSVVKYFAKRIGEEARQQILERYGKLPHSVVACVGGGSNAIGVFDAFLADGVAPESPYYCPERAKTHPTLVNLIGVEPAGHGLETDKHGAVLCKGTPGILHGMKSYVLQTPDGQIQETHSVSAGLDYPSVGPEHAFLQQCGRARYVSVTDNEALAAFQQLCHLEGIIPALESSHALAYGQQYLSRLPQDALLLINLSGRGDKDLNTVLAQI